MSIGESTLRRKVTSLTFALGKLAYQGKATRASFRLAASCIGLAGRCLPGYRDGRVTSALDKMLASGKIEERSNPAERWAYRLRLNKIMGTIDEPRDRDFCLFDLAKKQADIGNYDGAIRAANRIVDAMYRVSSLEYTASSKFKANKRRYKAEENKDRVLQIHRQSIRYSNNIDETERRVFTKKNIIIDMLDEGFNLEEIRGAFWQEHVMPLGTTMQHEGAKPISAEDDLKIEVGKQIREIIDNDNPPKGSG